MEYIGIDYMRSGLVILPTITFAQYRPKPIPLLEIMSGSRISTPALEKLPHNYGHNCVSLIITCAKTFLVAGTD